MRSPVQKVAAPAIRGLHTRAFATPRPQRSFHQTTFTSLPRKRNFFSSNQLLSNSSKDDVLPGADRVNQSEGAMTSQPSAPSKRRPGRPSAAKSLRLGSMTKQTKRAGTPTASRAPSAIDSDEKDYRRLVTSICVAQSFDMDQVQDILRFHAFELDPDQIEFDPQAVVHARGVNNGDIFVFPSGTVVGWSVPMDSLVTLATKQLIRAAEFPHVDRLEMEELEFVPDDTRDTSYMKGELVVLGTKAQGREDETLAKIAFASGLARSPKLAVLENNLIDYFQDSKPTFNALVGGSQLNVSRSSVMRMTGQLLSLRSQLNHYSDITDQLPDMFWDKESNLENYYNQIGATLDVKSRINILNTKITYAHENMSILRDMVSEKYGHRLEWIIIWLIAVEVMFELRRVWHESVAEQTEEKA
ncbi:hypothetical protein F4778DRAFT_682400 [Xylariomycetidae sp. FL2044]|nr:hypothetical protein F4778DRAFT_682400 [Xylariomycetidae sp. FL2044]